MKNYIWILIIIGALITINRISWLIEIISNSKKYLEHKNKLDNLDELIKKHIAQVASDKAELEAESKKRLDEFSQKVKKINDEFKGREKLWNKQIQADKYAIRKIAKQKSMGFPWLAEAYADYFALKDRKLEEYLKHKSHPALTAAEIVNNIKNENQKLCTENQTIKYKINYFENLFPWLEEFITDNENQKNPAILTGINNNELIEIIKNSKKYKNIQSELKEFGQFLDEHKTKIEIDKQNFETKVEEWEIEIGHKEKLWNKQIQADKYAIRKIAKQKSMGFPWLAEAYADYFALKDRKLEEYLKHKSHPALTAAERVKKIRQEKRELLKDNKIVNYKITYFEKLFPWLSELIADDEDEYIPVHIDNNENNNSNEDRTRDYLTPEEYKKLPSAERNQIALDRYLKNRNKSKWAIGRDYEMYVGYLYSKKGYSIEYKGILDGFEDLGRDIIAIKDFEVCIIQCKHWAQYKEIHEKHIFQLFGTTMEYWLNNYQATGDQWNLFTKSLNSNSPKKSFQEFAKILNENKLRPIFFTSTNLSKKAKEMAKALNVEVREKKAPGVFPRIKCNINNDEFGQQTKIYHLPMDQQYDRTIIGNKSGEFYAFTVKEAENAGFRRAFRHRHTK